MRNEKRLDDRRRPTRADATRRRVRRRRHACLLVGITRRRHITSFGEAVAAEARRRGVEGVVCGHIHHAELREIGDILYCNSGDWVESCTALVENFDGRLELVDWIDRWALDPLTGRIALPADLCAEAPALVDADS
jgi:hypothetical protein